MFVKVIQHRFPLRHLFYWRGSKERETIKACSDPPIVSNRGGGRQKIEMKIFTVQGDFIVLEGELNEWLEKKPYKPGRTPGRVIVSSGEQLFTMMSVWYDN